MPSWYKQYYSPAGPISLLALILFNTSLFSQKVEPLVPVSIANSQQIISGSLFRDNSPAWQKPGIVAPSDHREKINEVFYDSLKSKASKYILTRKLYDFVVVNGQSSVPTVKNESSEQEFIKYSGKKIHSIKIERLTVFGSDITDPLSSEPNKLENLLNKTHLNTNEFIIRKNLLFAEGDTISPLLLSDNERLLRQLPFIDDSRIVIVPGQDGEVDITVYTKDVYSLGLSADFQGIRSGSVSIFDKNILGLGHEFKIDMPFNKNLPNSPGFGVSYNIDNITKSFVNLDINYFYGLGQKTFGFSMDRKFVSATTKYAGGISVREMFTRVNLDTLPQAAPLKYNLQDYWLARSFLLDRQKVTRLIIGVRYTNNNVFNHPFILPNTYHYLQQYRIYLGSVSYSFQKYYKTSMLYAYGRTEDIPYGGLLTITAGKEINEFKDRVYTGINFSFGKSLGTIGFLNANVGVSSFFQSRHTEEGLFRLRANYFSNLVYAGRYKLRNFVKVDYTRGFDRYLDEHLHFLSEGGLSGVTNDSVGGKQRLSLSLESVLFSPRNYYGFRFAFFGYADAACLFGTNQIVANGRLISAIGLGIRIRNDNLLLNTIQIKLGFYPNLPDYSKVNYFSVSGEQMLKPDNFDPGPPSIQVYR
jgi:hypothetical protein